MKLGITIQMVSTSTLRSVLRLLERANLPSLRSRIIDYRIELLNREHADEDEAQPTTWVEQGRAA